MSCLRDYIPRDPSNPASMKKGLDESNGQLPSELNVRVCDLTIRGSDMKGAEDRVYGGEIISELIESGRKIRGVGRVVRVAIRRLERNENTNTVAMKDREPE